LLANYGDLEAVTMPSKNGVGIEICGPKDLLSIALAIREISDSELI